MRADNGFTFVEMLLVLTITLLITTVTMQYGYKKWEQVEAEFYLDQVLKDIQYIQSEARKTNTYIELRFKQFDDRWRYEFVQKKDSNENILTTRIFPKQIQVIQRESTMLVFRYTNEGRPSISGHITFQTDEGLYRIMIYLGEGIAKLEKLS